VRAQVDRGLTTVSCFDRLLRLIKNLGRHNKTAFITPHGIYYYKVMTFGLKTAGAIYQKAIQKCLKTQIGKNVIEGECPIFR
jgi:hypothetical protein